MFSASTAHIAVAMGVGLAQAGGQGGFGGYYASETTPGPGHEDGDPVTGAGGRDGTSSTGATGGPGGTIGQAGAEGGGGAVASGTILNQDSISGGNGGNGSGGLAGHGGGGGGAGMFVTAPTIITNEGQI